MGVLTLPDFTEELLLMLGNLGGIPSASLERWTNFGYLELATGVDFEILEEELEFSTVGGTQSYPGPTDPLAVKLVRNESQDYGLDWDRKTDLLRRPRGTQGPPEVWTRHKGDIVFWPTPIGADDILLVYKKSPDTLEGSDTTVLPAQWDQAILMFGASFGYHALGMADRGTSWFNRGVAYVQSRMTEINIYEGTAGLGLSQPSFSPEAI